jgi:hypothetical protein
VIVSKPKKTPLTSSRHEWVALPNAFDQIMTFAREHNLAGKYLNEDLRSGELGSKKVRFSPDGKRTETQLNPSDWEQWTVLVPSLRVHGWDANEGAHLFVRRVDLDRLYSSPATSNDTESSPQTTPARDKQKPGIKPVKDWPNSLLAPEMVRVALETPHLLRNRPELVRHVRKFLKDETGWEPKDNKPIHRELARLLSRIM